ncbi:ATP-binding cassette domain-containing protein [Tessaracoccus antarcticus]|uniref:ABC transporter ATP-binding protein n=1 Tax=Tessaracoccus antarcticus TaxID=2479848 RepID=A0A3M0GL40_9ACTN|nr:ABC transporter ATP-binding protein [Tessaracoccus antarcticus]RMB62333.1 ABC transporter ATP-binding protein [Tessaracoccus antarcticus]
MTAAIEVTNLTKRYGSITALDDVTVSIQQDSITGILGRNGAGKTVLMSVITAQEAPTQGTVRMFGQSPWENASVLSGTCFIRDNQRYPDEYRLAQLLRVGPLFYENWDEALAERIVETFEIPGGRSIRKLSRGQLSAVGLLMGLASRAPITFFDEPYLGLDITARTLFYDLLLEDYAAHPRTVVVSTHLIEEMEQLLERVVILHHGRVRENADIEDLRQRAVRLSGRTADLDRVVGGYEVLRRSTLGTLSTALVTSTDSIRGDAAAAGVDVEPASIHELVAAYGMQTEEVAR